MSTLDLEIQLLAVVVAVACALPGVFLVLRRMALLSDAISHSILLGIVLAFFWVRDLASPLLLVAAALTGLLTVALVEGLLRTGRVKEDTSIALVFPALFSIAVLLIARYAGSVHLDLDMVLLGELAFAPFHRMEVGGMDLGPKGLWVMGMILLANVIFIGLFYKELKLTTFDPALAGALGFSPVLMHYGFTSLVSLTAVGAFDAVGSILVVALMIAPPATAYLLTDRLSVLLVLSGVIAAGSALAGYWMATILDASIAGSMATACGGAFAAAFVLAPRRGLLAARRMRARQRWEFRELMLLIHLLHHEGTPEAETECREEHLGEHLEWSGKLAGRVIQEAGGKGLLEQGRDGRLLLTPRGRTMARDALEGT